jgi:hypothetical protein
MFPPPYTEWAQDPRNHQSSPELVCTLCGNEDDLTRAGDVFICRNQWGCEERVRSSYHARVTVRRRQKRVQVRAHRAA